MPIRAQNFHHIQQSADTEWQMLEADEACLSPALDHHQAYLRFKVFPKRLANTNIPSQSG
jgi:hypothetical protein